MRLARFLEKDVSKTQSKRRHFVGNLKKKFFQETNGPLFGPRNSSDTVTENCNAAVETADPKPKEHIKTRMQK